MTVPVAFEKVNVMMGSKLSDALKTMFPEELDEYMRSHLEGTYTLLDVRQPTEYEEAHLPGARLVPLPRLMDALGEMDSRRPTIVYCAAGGRSRTAAQFLLNQGFEEVFNLQGGIQAWEQGTASGPTEMHLRFVRGDEGPRDVIAVAYAMEEGLRQFHQRMKDATTDPGLGELLTHLIKAEESHKRALTGLVEEMTGDPTVPEALALAGSEVPAGSLMEGGLDIDEFMERNRPYLVSVAGYIDIAMMIEIQALDLYLRMAEASPNPQARQALRRIGDEEKAHLAILGRYLDEKNRRNLDVPVRDDA
jgi:rhodanese-related sulfurtransferase/rubrerythrin